MSHTHKHHHSDKSGLTLAFWLNLIFSIIELIGGTLTNSTAIIADAFHDFMDAIAIGAAVLLEKISGKKRTSQFSYGYKRFSLLAALGMSVFLLVGSVLMVISAVKSFVNPETVNSVGMLWLAILGVVVNGLAFLRIKKGGTHHHHQGHNHNSKAIMLHLIEDILGWVAVLVGAAIIYFTGWYWIDGILALAIGLFIGYNATKNLKSTLRVILQGIPDDIDLKELSSELSKIKEVENVHDLHVWSLDGNYNIGSLHILASDIDKLKVDIIHKKVIQVMKNHHIQHHTVQIETTIKNCGFINC